MKGELFLSHLGKLNVPSECGPFLQGNSPMEYINKQTFVDCYAKTGQTKQLNIILQKEEWFDKLVTIDNR